MRADRARLTIDQDKCQPCPGLVCIGVCPQGVLEPDADNKPKLSDENACTLCEVCLDLCPAKAITITKESSKK